MACTDLSYQGPLGGQKEPDQNSSYNAAVHNSYNFVGGLGQQKPDPELQQQTMEDADACTDPAEQARIWRLIQESSQG